MTTQLIALLADRHALLAEIRRRVAKYSEDQPRVPAGSPEGGQWTSGDGDGGAQSSGDKPDMSTIRLATNYRSGVELGAAVPPDKHRSTWTPERGGTLLHGAQMAFNNNWKTDVAYLTDDFEEAKQYALGVHLGGSGGKYPMVQRFEGLAGKTLDIDHYLAKAMSEDWDPGEALDIAFDHARSSGARYVTYEHPSNFYGDRMQRVVVSLYPKEDLRFKTLWRVSRRKPKALTKILLQDVPVLADLAARLEPMLRKRFEAVIKQIKGTIDGEMLVELANAIGSGNISRAEALLKMGEWPERFGGMATDLRAGFIVGTRVGMTALSNVNVSLDFKLVDSHTVEYARRRLPPLVQSIKDSAREMVRQTMTESVQGKWTPFEAAEGIRDWIGLTAQQASASAKFERDLIDRGIPLEKIVDRVAKYEDALLRQRAETIARTEIQYAANAGQIETWQEATRQGLLSKGTKKVWLTANDERLCPVCENLGNAEPVGLNEQFVYDDGTKAETVFGEPLHAPPQHPNCRCTTILELE